ncbi:MAG: LacI family DNA-binding transcriptional regulator, partial [Ignavibacteriae bacterium]|nr:LacI family DNA-binding transcriptional regulator [Ignavibacteriota bacterium]
MTLNKVTIKTIAKKINVSPATVSKALRDSHDISDQTKLKIKNLAKKLGYKPNLMARNLVSKKSNIIGVIVPDISTSFFGLTVRGINYAARKHNYEVIILVNDEDHKVERKNIEFISNLQVDGILIDSVPGNHNLDLLEELSENGMPIVFVDRKCKKINADSVTTDDIKAGYTITKYFLKNNKSK